MCSDDRAPSTPVSIPPGVALIPEDFSERLTAVRDLLDLNWEEMSVGLGVDPRQLLRWRIKGGAPNGERCWPWCGWRSGRRRGWGNCWTKT